jgi:hypothetical protein
MDSNGQGRLPEKPARDKIVIDSGAGLDAFASHL